MLSISPALNVGGLSGTDVQLRPHDLQGLRALEADVAQPHQEEDHADAADGAQALHEEGQGQHGLAGLSLLRGGQGCSKG